MTPTSQPAQRLHQLESGTTTEAALAFFDSLPTAEVPTIIGSFKQQGITMTHLGNIRESDIQTAVSMADLDAACAYLQDIADIEDGGIAALAFSDVNFDWSAANRGERESAIRAWLKLEAIHTAAR